MSEKRPLRGLYRNTWSYFGALIIAGSAVLIAFALLAQFTIAQPSAYVGMLTFLVFPFIMAMGGALVLFGMWRESRRRRKAKSDEAQAYPTLDLNDARQRRRFGISVVAGTVVALVFVFGVYNGYRFTESVAFCGKLCHTVMEPEYQAYQYSPHARVPCVDCHVGEGTGWYVKSKLSGVRQVWAVLTDDYERPIPTPVANLRPARETCEHCHWPDKFYGASLVQLPHFRYDEDNTPEQISLLMRTGGGAPPLNENAGIHWHMVVGNQVEFVATDRQDQTIPWTRVTRPDGSTTEYRDERTQETDEALAARPRHKFDCIDCHNRPSHDFRAPERSVDRAMRADQISPSLPWIKRTAVEALTRPYDSRDSAHEGIRREVETFYRESYAELAQSRAAEIGRAVETLRGIYDASNFPRMNVDWRTYPNNIGHRAWPGCFRCHDGRHVSADGAKLSADCELCHTAPVRGPVGALGDVMPAGDEDWHPWELPAEHLSVGAHSELLCHECHSAGFRPSQQCEDCHR